MNKHEFIQKGLERIEEGHYKANPFLATRVDEALKAKKSESMTVRRPAWALAVLGIVLLLNMGIIFNAVAPSQESSWVDEYGLQDQFDLSSVDYFQFEMEN